MNSGFWLTLILRVLTLLFLLGLICGLIALVWYGLGG